MRAARPSQKKIAEKINPFLKPIAIVWTYVTVFYKTHHFTQELIMTLFILIKKNINFFQIFKFLFLMIAYLLLYLHAKFEDQEAMGSRH